MLLPLVEACVEMLGRIGKFLSVVGTLDWKIGAPAQSIECVTLTRDRSAKIVDARSGRNVSEISRNQIIRTSASAKIDLGCGGTYQITVGIESVQKTRFIRAGIGLNSPQLTFV